MRQPGAVQHWTSAFGVAIPMIILPIVVLSIPVSAAAALQLTPAELSSWIVMLYGLPAVLGTVLSYIYKQPLIMTGNIFIMIFIASLEGEHRFSDLVGATMLAGLAVLVISAIGMTDRLSQVIPSPIVLGLLAGAVLPFVIDIFGFLGAEPIVVGTMIAAYLLCQRIMGARVPPILPALVAGLVAISVTGETTALPDTLAAPSLTLTVPTLTFETAIAIAPIMVILLTLQSTIPSVVFLRTQGYEPDERRLSSVGGIFTAIGSLGGATGISLSLPATSLVAGPHAGDARYRHHVVYIANAGALGVTLLAGIAGSILTIVPLWFLLSIAGLAAIGILSHALQEATRGPLVLGPLLAFATSLSDISLFGFGPFFWGLVIGTAASMIAERDALRALRLKDQRSG